MSGTSRCDVCNFRDGHQGLTLIICNTCHLSVHRECYGMDTYLKKTFQCWACQSVGKSFQIDELDADGKRRSIIQEQRPHKCELCSISTGLHAMHPLYDNAGPKARQIHRTNKKTGQIYLAWAHTLCTLALSVDGLLYGCCRDGAYEGWEEDPDCEWTDDDRSLNPELEMKGQEPDSLYGSGAPVHHFVYTLQKAEKPPNTYTEAIESHQRNNRCMFCFSNDTQAGSLRIAVRCVAGTESEHDEFRGKHFSLGPNEVCSVSLHVGCAKWGGNNPNNLRRVFYFPGNSVTEPVVCQYCNLHAEEIKGGMSRQRETALQHENDQYRGKTSKAIAQRGMKAWPVSSPRKKVAQGRKPTVRLHQNLNKSQAVPISKLERPTLMSNRKELSSHQSVVPMNGVVNIYKDLHGRIVDAGITDPEQRSQVISIRKKYWKRELSELTSEDFIKLWRRAKTLLRESIVKEQEKAANTIDLTENDPYEPPKGPTWGAVVVPDAGAPSEAAQTSKNAADWGIATAGAPKQGATWGAAAGAPSASNAPYAGEKKGPKGSWGQPGPSSAAGASKTWGQVNSTSTTSTNAQSGKGSWGGANNAPGGWGGGSNKSNVAPKSGTTASAQGNWGRAASAPGGWGGGNNKNAPEVSGEVAANGIENPSPHTADVEMAEARAPSEPEPTPRETWSDLYLGPGYRTGKFEFGEWDTVEMM